MACHQIDVFLGKTVHTLTFRDEVSDIFMILLQSGLLIGNIRIAVKDIGTMLSILCFFNTLRILEFRTIVRKNNWEMRYNNKICSLMLSIEAN